MPRPSAVCLFALLALAPAAADPPKADAKPAPGKNRLGAEVSPYLKLHADNPVHWYAWGPEAFAAAKAQNKPIFLSVGYSSCHWCHVMNRESFASAKLAAFLNEHFICIKVDREERPDVDAVYMNALQAIGGHGGWPMSMFLLPDGRPFFGGTYFPPADRKDAKGEVTQTGFDTLLATVVRTWRDRRPALEKQAGQIQQALAAAQAAGGASAREPIPYHLIEAALGAISGSLDPVHGGLGSPPFYRPKFPQPSVGLFFLDAVGPGQDAILNPIILQADKMARGGIYDHVGGGFHRYSVDREWVVPHFEKMLYDQAQLLSFYSRLHQRRPDPRYARVVAETIAFLRREMLGPDGLFYSALDADSEHEEGKYYVWTRDQFKTAAGAEADAAMALMGILDEPNFEGRYIPMLRRAPAEVAAGLKISEAELLRRWDIAKISLLAAREKRVRPAVDIKAILAWNCLLILGLVDAYDAFPDPQLANYRLARRTADQVLKVLGKPDGSFHRYAIGGKARGDAYADDYAAAALALATMHRLHPAAEGPSPYLAPAERCMEILVARFWDEATQGFYYTPQGGETLISRPREDYDGAVPSANSLAALALVELAKATGKPAYGERAAMMLRASRKHMADGPSAASAMLRVLALHKKLPAPVADPERVPPIQAVAVVPGKLEGKPGDPATFEVRVTVAPGWHIGANPPSRFVNPTELVADAKQPMTLVKVRYPGVRESKLLGDRSSPDVVYEGTVVLRVEATIRADAAPGPATARLQLRYTACDERRCLAPAVREVAVPVTVRPK